MLYNTVNQLRKEAYGEISHWLKYYGQSKLRKEDVQQVLEEMISKYIKECRTLVKRYQRAHPNNPLYLTDAIIACKPSLVPSGEYKEIEQSHQNNYVAQKMNVDYLSYTICQDFIKRNNQKPNPLIDEQWAEIDERWKKIVQNMQDRQKDFKTMEAFIQYSTISKDTIYAKDRKTSSATLNKLVDAYNQPFKDVPGAKFVANENMFKSGVFAYKCRLAMTEEAIDIATLSRLVGTDNDTLQNILDGSTLPTSTVFEKIIRQLAKPPVYFFYFVHDTKTRILGKEPYLCFLNDENLNLWTSQQNFSRMETSYFDNLIPDTDGDCASPPSEPNPYYWLDNENEQANNASDKMYDAFSALM